MTNWNKFDEFSENFQTASDPPVLENVFVPPPTNFGQKVPPKARNRDKADFATKVHKSCINHVNVHHEQ